MAPRCLPQGRLATQVGPPGGLVFQHHQPLQGLQMVGHGARVEGPIGTTGIGRQGGQLHLGGHVAAEGAQQGPQPLGISAAAIQPLHVHLAHLLQVIAGGAAGRRQGPLQLGRPAAAAHQLGQIRHAQSRMSAAGEHRRHLPFIQQTRPGPRQHQGRIHRQRLAGGGVHIQQHRGGGQLPGQAGLAAGLGALDHHRAGGSQAGARLAVSDAGAVAGGHTAAANAADVGTLMLETSNF